MKVPQVHTQLDRELENAEVIETSRSLFKDSLHPLDYTEVK